MTIQTSHNQQEVLLSISTVTLWPSSQRLLPGKLQALRLRSHVHLSCCLKSFLSTKTSSGTLPHANPIWLHPCLNPHDGFLCWGDGSKNDL